MKQLLYTLQPHLTARYGLVSFCVITALISAIVYSTSSYQISTSASSSSPQKNNFIQQENIACAPRNNNYSYLGMETIEPNDNRLTSGQLKDGILTLNLEAREGVWYPETPVNPGILVYAFAEEGKRLQIPGPLIRVPEGTKIQLSIRNNISGKPLNLHGFHTRPGAVTDSVIIAPGAIWTTSFKTGEAGTFYYKGTAGGRQVAGWPVNKDGQLYGGIIIEKTGVKIDTAERILMVGRYFERAPTKKDTIVAVVNGLSWPFSERLTYTVGKPVNWRVINSSAIGHPMHLHGFYFNVNSLGDAENEKQFSPKDTRKVVTQLLLIGQTMRMSWLPERPGNWLFHCHMLIHISPDIARLRPKLTVMPDTHELQHHIEEDMAGLIMGIHVLPNGGTQKKKSINIENRRQINLVVKDFDSPYDSVHSFRGLGFVLQTNKTIESKWIPTLPGPPIIIQQNEPVAINVINQSKEATVIHWHGIELESYFDGVAGWGLQGTQITPIIEAGQVFTAEITAPHAGTFIYHTHMHDNQLMRGLYGPLIVMKPGEKFDSSTNKIIVISDVRSLKTPPPNDRKYLINGSLNPEPLHFEKGKKYRLRLINITEGAWSLQISMLFNNNFIQWKALAKDGAELPVHQSITGEANRQRIAVGETMDFEFFPQQTGEYRFEVHFNNYVTNIKVAEMLMRVK